MGTTMQEQLMNDLKWYVVKLFKNGELVLVDKIDSSAVAPALDFQAKGYDINNCEKQNTFAISVTSANEKIKGFLSEYFEKYGRYPKYNHEDFLKDYESYIPCHEGWEGPIEIDEGRIEQAIKTGHKNGNYKYGHFENGKFVVDYVGRCTDQELSERAKHRLDPNDNNYKEFNKRETSHLMFRYAENDKEAIQTECMLYHYYGGRVKLINHEHPSLPDDIKCPVSLCMKS